MQQSDKIIIGLTIICCIVMLMCVFISDENEKYSKCATPEVVNENVVSKEKQEYINDNREKFVENASDLKQKLKNIYGENFIVYDKEEIDDVDFSEYIRYYIHPEGKNELRFIIDDNKPINKSIYYFSQACMELNDYLENGKTTYIPEANYTEVKPKIEGLTVLPIIYDCEDVYPNKYEGHMANHLVMFENDYYECICLVDKDIDRVKIIKEIIDRLDGVVGNVRIQVAFVSKSEKGNIILDYNNMETISLERRYDLIKNNNYLELVQNGFTENIKIHIIEESDSMKIVESFDYDNYIKYLNNESDVKSTTESITYYDWEYMQKIKD